MAPGKRTFSPEFPAEAVKLVIDSSRPIAQVARELGIGEATLGETL
jgi:transposase-like protein